MDKKTEIIKRLVDDKSITFDEALILLEKEKEYIYVPYYNNPYVNIGTPGEIRYEYTGQ